MSALGGKRTLSPEDPNIGFAPIPIALALSLTDGHRRVIRPPFIKGGRITVCVSVHDNRR